ncbi:winged helix-turn-helix transcriptional regulator [Modestobacter muralis]|uniref:Winged helix-turn-helix transcriptional regulator n=1 Tax=Modestobacter muralis TaxID=1608614 RepID=A0A6P0H4E9_9ACTN|nr:winged helix-turn-helix transcriptional regulator [Modestobacter muralis]NEN49993.1 winged helix-turn-helix transcriptional regulator [Modestobacter muralis]
MHAFDVLGDPVRRRMLELLAEGEQPAGRLAAVVHEEFGISQPGASQHLRVLRENGFARVRAEGNRRLYAVDTAALREVDAWLAGFRRFWDQRLDALATELARGARTRPTTAGEGPAASTEEESCRTWSRRSSPPTGTSSGGGRGTPN